MSKIAKGCAGCVVIPVLLVIIVGTVTMVTRDVPAPAPLPSSPSSTSSTDPSSPSSAPIDRSASLAIVDAPDPEQLRDIYREASATLKELDAMAKRPKADQYVRADQLHAGFVATMARFDDLAKASPDGARVDIALAAQSMLAWHRYTIPTDATPADAKQGREDALKQYGQAIQSAKSWSSGPASNYRPQWAELARQAVEQKRKTITLYAYVAVLDQFGLAGTVVKGASRTPDGTFTLTLAPEWNLMNKAIRLQTTQAFYGLAAAFVKEPYLILQDEFGNHLGGSASRFSPSKMQVPD